MNPNATSHSASVASFCSMNSQSNVATRAMRKWMARGASTNPIAGVSRDPPAVIGASHASSAVNDVGSGFRRSWGLSGERN